MRHSSEPGMLLDIASYARRGPVAELLSQEEIALIARTFAAPPKYGQGAQPGRARPQSHRSPSRLPESRGRGGRSRPMTVNHSRGRGSRRSCSKTGIWTWMSIGARPTLSRGRVGPPKLVHKVMFSMPAGHRQTRCWRRSRSSRGRNSGSSIATQWCCTPMSRTPTCTWSSRR